MFERGGGVLRLLLSAGGVRGLESLDRLLVSSVPTTRLDARQEGVQVAEVQYVGMRVACAYYFPLFVG